MPVLTKEEARKLGRRIVSRVTKLRNHGIDANSSCSESMNHSYHVHVYIDAKGSAEALRSNVIDYIMDNKDYVQLWKQAGPNHSNYGTLDIPFEDVKDYTPETKELIEELELALKTVKHKVKTGGKVFPDAVRYLKTARTYVENASEVVT